MILGQMPVLDMIEFQFHKYLISPWQAISWCFDIVRRVTGLQPRVDEYGRFEPSLSKCESLIASNQNY